MYSLCGKQYFMLCDLYELFFFVSSTALDKVPFVENKTEINVKGFNSKVVVLMRTKAVFSTNWSVEY